tara:strand:- start:504 stop:953 length:450 start_codon:yes stop_codon:yes gene_type:complete
MTIGESLKQREQRLGYKESQEEKYEKHLKWLKQYKEQYIEEHYGREPEQEDIERVCQHTYVNTYECDQAKGGNEEGGWWYDVGVPVESIYFEYRYEAEEAFPEIESKWNRLNEIEGRREPSSVSCDGYYQTYYGAKYGDFFPKERPHYE